jgi:hypothetical protein
MLTYISKHSEIKSEFIVSYLKDEKDLSSLLFLKLDANILKDIKKSLGSKKSSKKDYFL